jgi:hypothetical protein
VTEIASAATEAMFKNIITALLISATLIIGSAFPAVTAPLTLYSTEEQAQQHCPSDVVVWLNLPTHIYHWKGMRWYGNTKNGAYVCKKEADENGNRGTLNGQ